MGASQGDAHALRRPGMGGDEPAGGRGRDAGEWRAARSIGATHPVGVVGGGVVEGFGWSRQGAKKSEIGSFFWHASGVRHLIAEFALGVASLNPWLQAVAPPGDHCGSPCSSRLPV